MVALLQLAAVLVLPVALAYAAAADLLTMTIPNRISLALLAGFFPAALAVGLGWETAGMHLLVGAGVLALTFGMFSVGWIGGGDAKLAAAVTLWMGPSMSLAFLVYAALIGGVLASIFIGFRKLPLPVFAAREDWIQRLHAPENGVPYGIALAGGALMAFPETPWFKAVTAFMLG
jgi:prepilin peptidase CpaA